MHSARSGIVARTDAAERGGAMPSPASPATAPAAPESRITLIDALRGSALAGLFFVHCVEHFELARYPQNQSPLLKQLDGWTNDTAFFLFSGKAYAIFAMMFGVSFMLILQSWTKKGIDVRTRFPWRLLILGALGYLNALVYSGDILLVLAILGLPLVFLYRLPDKVLGWLAVLFLLQIPNAWEALRCIVQPAYAPAAPLHWNLYNEVCQAQAESSLPDLLRLLAWKGQGVRLLFTYETGRYTQMLGLFLCGLLIGRHHLFENATAARRLAWRALILGIVGFALFQPLKSMLADWGVTGMRGYYVSTWLGAYCNLAQMAVWVGGFVLLYLGGWRRALDWFVPLGRMSLTAYVTQAMFFVPFFYGYGLGLYRHLGQFHSVLCGLAFIVVQTAVAKLWLRHFQYGPLEWLWRAGTNRTFRTPFRRRAQVAAAVPEAPASELAGARD